MARSFIMRKAGIKWAILISVFCYLSFFGKLLNPNYFFWGSDITFKHFPVRVYLQERIKEGSYPFWTERLFSGFPIYADPEHAYLHPLNVISILFFGSMNSYKILHFLTYLLGSLSLFEILRRRGINHLGFFVSNLVYFFSFFTLYHQLHFNIIMVAYLFPTTILLTDCYIHAKKIRFIILNSLVITNGVYWGSLQVVLIGLMGLLVYVICYAYKAVDYKKIVFYIVFLSLLVLTESLPQLYPSYLLFQKSPRSEGASFKLGSYTPTMALSLVHPHIFGAWPNYRGEEVNPDYNLHETYVYIGISSFLLSLFFLLFAKTDRNKYFILLSLLVFVILGFIKFIPLLSDIKLPVISYFRYWQRSFMIALFAISLIAGWLVGSKDGIKAVVQKPVFILPIFIIFVLYILNISNPIDVRSRILMGEMFWSGSDVKVVVFIALLTMLLMLSIKLMGKNIATLAKVILALLVYLDLLFFAKPVLNERLVMVPEIPSMKAIISVSNGRVVYDYPRIKGEEALYYPYWGIFGYSQLVNSSYKWKLLKIGFDNERSSSGLEVPNMLDDLKNMGVTTVYALGNSYVLHPKDSLELLKGGFTGTYLRKDEGVLKFRLDVDKPQEIRTFIRKFDGWRLFVDGKSQELLTTNDLYYSFNLDVGSHIVELVYFPLPFLYAVLASLVLTPLLLYFGMRIGNKL